MKPVLIFQSLSVFNDGIIETVTSAATVNGHQVNFTTLPVPAETSDHHEEFRNALRGILLKATVVVNNQGKVLLVYGNMVLSDNLACYEIKQTVGFNNAMHKAGLDTSVILNTIW